MIKVMVTPAILPIRTIPDLGLEMTASMATEGEGEVVVAPYRGGRGRSGSQ